MRLKSQFCRILIHLSITTNNTKSQFCAKWIPEIPSERLMERKTKVEFISLIVQSPSWFIITLKASIGCNWIESPHQSFVALVHQHHNTTTSDDIKGEKKKSANYLSAILNHLNKILECIRVFLWPIKTFIAIENLDIPFPK